MNEFQQEELLENTTKKNDLESWELWYFVSKKYPTMQMSVQSIQLTDAN